MLINFGNSFSVFIVNLIITEMYNIYVWDKLANQNGRSTVFLMHERISHIQGPVLDEILL